VIVYLSCVEISNSQKTPCVLGANVTSTKYLKKKQIKLRRKKLKDNVVKVQEPIKLIAKQVFADELLQADASLNQDEAIQRNTIGELNELNGKEKESKD